MERNGTGAESADCPFCGCPAPPSGDAGASWSCAACGAFGRMQSPQNGPILA